MHALRFVALFAAAAGFCAAAGPKPELYRARREALMRSFPESAVVLFGRTDNDVTDDRTGFFQEPNVYYLTGWSEPGAMMLLAPGADVLFLPRQSAEHEKWTGPLLGPGDAARARTGFASVMPVESFEAELRKTLGRANRIYTVSEQAIARLRALAPLREVDSAAMAIARLRMRKSPDELELIERATDVTVQAQRAAWNRAGAGVFEYQVAAAFTGAYLDRGCERSAYAPIVGSGPNAVYLHYSRNTRKMDAGELVLIDAAAECSGYASDVTRTIPVSGRFAPRQRELYDIVLGAENAVVAALKPGATLGRNTPNTVYKVALDYFNAHRRGPGGEPLGKYFTHGIGHHVGLEVHDAFDPAIPLEEGMVVTVEPGLYIPEEQIGIRIEDLVRVTAEGGKLLSGALPREAADIEKALRR